MDQRSLGERDICTKFITPALRFAGWSEITQLHRGNSADAPAGREILDHFSSATQIGLTATPKETGYASNIGYFGEAVNR